MTQTDQLKVMQRGFKIIRKDENALIIKSKTLDSQNWTILYNGFPSKAALKRKMEELLKYDLTIED